MFTSLVPPEEQGFPATPGVVQQQWGGGICTFGGLPSQQQVFPCPDAFVIKLDARGQVAFATYLGGFGFDQATSIGVDAAGQSATKVHVEYNGFSSQVASAIVAQAAPAFFRSYTSPQGAIVNEDGTPNSASNSAQRGSVVSIFGTGAGPMSPLAATGGIAPLDPLAVLTLPFSVQWMGTMSTRWQRTSWILK